MSPALFNLPHDFGVPHDDTLVYFYSSNRSSAKNKVMFTKNMFCLLQHGVKEVHTATGKETVTSNELLMLTSGSVLMSESMGHNHRYEAILVFFGNQTLIDFCARQSIAVSKKTKDRPILKITRDAFLDHYCHSLRLLQQDDDRHMHAIKTQEILAYVSKKHPVVFAQLVSQALADHSDIRLKQVVELNLNKGLTVEELAFLCNMSLSTFKRHFTAVYGQSPQKYFAQVKMAQALRLLRLNKRPSVISAELGYENLSAFSNEFKKHYGLSPKQYREQNEPGAQVFEPTE